MTIQQTARTSLASGSAAPLSPSAVDVISGLRAVASDVRPSSASTTSAGSDPTAGAVFGLTAGATTDLSTDESSTDTICHRPETARARAWRRNYAAGER